MAVFSLRVTCPFARTVDWLGLFSIQKSQNVIESLSHVMQVMLLDWMRAVSAKCLHPGPVGGIVVGTVRISTYRCSFVSALKKCWFGFLEVTMDIFLCVSVHKVLCSQKVALLVLGDSS